LNTTESFRKWKNKQALNSVITFLSHTTVLRGVLDRNKRTLYLHGKNPLLR